MPPIIRKRIINPNHEKLTQINGLYVHSNPPRVLSSINASRIRHWIRVGDFDKLDQVILEGEGAKLLSEYTHDNKIRTYLKAVPFFMSKIDLIHDAVSGNSLSELQSLLAEDGGKRKLASCKDQAGVGLLHKAVYYDLPEIVHFLVDNYTYLIHQRDKEGRTPCHYCGACRDPQGMMRILTNAGADSNVTDLKGHTPQYYIDHPVELELPQSPKTMAYLGVQKKPKEEGLVIKPSNIRIWIHQKDIGKLQKVLWEGHGNKLRTETSNNPKVKRFLEGIPYMMSLIKEIHMTVINDNIAAMKEKTADPVPSVILTSKDSNGLTVLHKAAGLGRMEMAEYILDRCPETISICDNEGRTPLHYAAAAKDHSKMYNFLMEHGADEAKLDNKQKTAGYYRNRPNDIDSKLLVVVPEAPRTPGNTFPPNWDWSLLTNDPNSSNTGQKLKKVDENNENGQKNGEKEEMEEIKESNEEKEEKENDETKEKDSEEEQEKEENNDDTKENGHEAEISNGNHIESENEESEDAKNESEKSNKNHEQNEETLSNSHIKVYERNNSKDEDQEKDENHHSNEDENESNENHTENPESNEKPKTSNSNTEQRSIKSTPKENGSGSTRGNKTPSNTPRHTDSTPRTTNGNGKSSSTHNDENEEDDDKHSERVIEGIVEGEQEQLNNDGQDPSFLAPSDDEVKDMVESANMEQLATLVLNGDGSRLIGQKSNNPELQVFLDNVASYMDKIKRVHLAAREGSLRDLQAALDRRKFAIAKDKVSPNGASPLHVAVIFGNTSIVRYLAGRFPETLQVQDHMGRTPLHYAATLADNGHYYNLLLHLGANAKIQDNLGHMAEYYRNNSEELSHEDLLRDFGAEDQITNSKLTDRVQDDVYSARRIIDDPDLLSTLERCYRLLHERRGSVGTARSSISSVKPVLNSYGTLAGKYLRRHIYDQIKARITRMDHNLYDIVWPSIKVKTIEDPRTLLAMEEDFPGGIVAPDYYIYHVFYEYMILIIKDLHWINIHSELQPQPKPFFYDMSNIENMKEQLADIDIDLDPYQKFMLRSTVECTRNFEHSELPVSLNLGSLEDVERVLTTVLLEPEITEILNIKNTQVQEKGIYYTLNEILENPSEIHDLLERFGLLIPLWKLPNNENNRLHGRHWPYGRGVFVSPHFDVAFWVNVLDHLRIVVVSEEDKPGYIGKAYIKMAKIVTVIDQKLRFKRDHTFGFLSSRPTSIGNTLRFNCTVRFTHLSKDGENIKHLCLVRGLSFLQKHKERDIITVGNQQSLGVNELQTFQDFTTALANILQLEKDLALSNSMHIATLFVNIFKRKKSTLHSGSI